MNANARPRGRRLDACGGLTKNRCKKDRRCRFAGGDGCVPKAAEETKGADGADPGTGGVDGTEGISDACPALSKKRCKRDRACLYLRRKDSCRTRRRRKKKQGGGEGVDGEGAVQGGGPAPVRPTPCTYYDVKNAEGCAEGDMCKIGTGDCRLRVGQRDGVCQTPPRVCTFDWEPVCGCDGVTYPNECGALGAGVNVAQVGECEDSTEREPPPAAPGEPTRCTYYGVGNAEGCAEGDMCKIGTGDCRLRIRQQDGVCHAVPEGCTKHWRPVCGCDGVTYGNECGALSAGVNVDSVGCCPDDEGCVDDATPPAPRYLKSEGPLDARVRVVDPSAADGYSSCDDLREDIGEALKHYANRVIRQQAEPYNDWYEKCDCDSDEPCRNPSWGYYSFSLDAGAPEMAVMSAALPTTAKGGAAEPAQEDSFGTNNQVEGVDEGDIVKSDGVHVFAAYGDVLYAWKASDGREGTSITRMPYEELDESECPPPPFYPLPILPLEPLPEALPVEPRPPVATKEEAPDEIRRGRRRASYAMPPNPCHKPKPRIRSLLLSGSRLTAVVSEDRGWGWHRGGPEDDAAPILDDRGKLAVRVYDVSEVPADGRPLRLLGEREIAGDFDAARSVGDVGHVVTTSRLNTNSFANDLYRDRPRYCGLNATAYEAVAAEVAVDNVAPFVERMIEEMRLELDGACDGVFRIAALQSGESDEDRNRGVLLSQFVQVLSFDASADFVNKEISARVGGAFSSGWLRSVYASQNFAATLNVGSHYDEDTGDWSQATFVLGFDIGGAVPKPLCYAELPGSPLNQYSVDLYQDHLRVVTTENNWRLQTDRTKNKIFVLGVPDEDEGREMIKVGESDHVGKPNESVYSVRFIGPRAYVVTFERVDPFYIYDLSDPANPTKLGELEIPGYSSYLHPIEIEGVPLMLGIGEAVDEESQRRVGVKISLFDISNEESPREAATLVDEGAYSTANNDFKAFRYLPQSQKLILPKSEWSGSDRDNFDGFVVYDVSLDAIAPVHEIEHARSSDMFYGCWYNAYMPARSLVFQSKLTTILSHSVISTDLADGRELWGLNLDEGLNNTECSPYFYGF